MPKHQEPRYRCGDKVVDCWGITAQVVNGAEQGPAPGFYYWLTSNTQILYRLHESLIRPDGPESWGYMWTLHDVMKVMHPDKTCYDLALPQPWVDKFKSLTGVYPVSRFVWAYDEGNKIFGRPFPVHPDAAADLALYNQLAGTAYPTE